MASDTLKDLNEDLFSKGSILHSIARWVFSSEATRLPAALKSQPMKNTKLIAILSAGFTCDRSTREVRPLRHPRYLLYRLYTTRGHDLAIKWSRITWTSQSGCCGKGLPFCALLQWKFMEIPRRSLLYCTHYIYLLAFRTVQWEVSININNI